MDPLAPLAALASSQPQANPGAPSQNTTIGVVLTNVSLTKAQAKKVASTTHDAYARAIKPVHTSADGDAIFALSSCEVDAPYDLAAVLATEAMQGAIERAATQARSSHGYPAACDL